MPNPTPEQLKTMADNVESTLRSVGLYVDSIAWINPGDEDEDEDTDTAAAPKQEHARKGHYVLLVNADIGAVAFSARVQDPEQYDMDAEFALMTSELRKEQFKDGQKNILKSLDDLTNL